MLTILPLDVENDLYNYLNIKSLNQLIKVNKYLASTLQKKINILASNKIKYFFKRIVIPKNIYDLEQEEENKLTKREWIKLYYFYYDKHNILSQIHLIVRKIGWYYGEERQNHIQSVLDDSLNLSKRYRLVNCIKNMTKKEIEDVGW